MKLQIFIDGRSYDVETPPIDDGRVQRQLVIDGETYDADIVGVEPGVFSILIDGKSVEAVTADDGHVWIDSARFEVEQRDPRQWCQGQADDTEHGIVTIKAAMPGKVVEVLVKSGEMIETGQGILVVEAMKMQNEVKSPKSGTIKAVQVAAGDSVSAGQALVIVE
jgi:biotin carboxyl carrier protein